MQSFYQDEHTPTLHGDHLQAEHAEDVAQETMLRVLLLFQNGEVLRKPAMRRGFFQTISTDVSLEMLRENAEQVVDSAYLNRQVDLKADLENDMLANERKELTRRALRQLPGKEQFLIRRLFLEEADRDQVCEQLHISRQYLRVLVHRAICHMRTAIESGRVRAGQSHRLRFAKT